MASPHCIKCGCAVEQKLRSSFRPRHPKERLCRRAIQRHSRRRRESAYQLLNVLEAAKKIYLQAEGEAAGRDGIDAVAHLVHECTDIERDLSALASVATEAVTR